MPPPSGGPTKNQIRLLSLQYWNRDDPADGTSWQPIDGVAEVESTFILQCLERNLLGLMHARPINRLQLGQELTLQRIVIRRRPFSMLLERLGDAHLEIQASSADLTRDGGT